MHKNVPYFCQWESPELAKQILEKQISTDDDPKWKNSGAKTKEEYHDWSWSGCGMACTKMILAHRTGKTTTLVELGKKCVEYGGYTIPLETSPGLFYKPYVEFVAKEFGWKARIAQGSTLQELMHELGKGNYFIASVSPHIRYPQRKPKNKSGHLVLMLGYDVAKRELYFHNPSGISKSTQQCAAIKFTDFKKFFSGRGIVVEVLRQQ
ncbi:MAG TPA: C39 family peptidase [Candidatus Acidoferrum sp.]|nr:C39 family peptidase [Candidatus Acidoferrum sp.]